MTQTTIDNTLFLEVLRKSQADVSPIREDRGQQLISLPVQIHNLQGDLLRLGKNVMHRLDRIELLLESTDA